MSLLLRLPIALRLQVLLWTAGSCPYDGDTRGSLASPYGYPPLRAFVSLGYGIWHREFLRRSNWWAVSCSYVCLPLPADPLTAPALMLLRLLSPLLLSLSLSLPLMDQLLLPLLFFRCYCLHSS